MEQLQHLALLARDALDAGDGEIDDDQGVAGTGSLGNREQRRSLKDRIVAAYAFLAAITAGCG